MQALPTKAEQHNPTSAPITAFYMGYSNLQNCSCILLHPEWFRAHPKDTCPYFTFLMFIVRCSQSPQPVQPHLSVTLRAQTASSTETSLNFFIQNYSWNLFPHSTYKSTCNGDAESTDLLQAIRKKNFIKSMVLLEINHANN